MCLSVKGQHLGIRRDKDAVSFIESDAAAVVGNGPAAIDTEQHTERNTICPVNELDVPILCMGLKDVVVSASPEGILVSDKEQSSYIKPFVNTLDHRVMFAEKSWGSFKVIDIDKASMTIKVTLNAGHRMNYHSHQHRDEVWTVIAGKGKHAAVPESTLCNVVLCHFLRGLCYATSIRFVE